jgi:hypothetical protein
MVEWRYSLDIWRDIGGNLHATAGLHPAKSSKYILDKRLTGPKRSLRSVHHINQLLTPGIKFRSFGRPDRSLVTILAELTQRTAHGMTTIEYPNAILDTVFHSQHTVQHDTSSDTAGKRVPNLEIRTEYCDFRTWHALLDPQFTSRCPQAGMHKFPENIGATSKF